MSTSTEQDGTGLAAVPSNAARAKPLAPAARRALEEAAARRAASAETDLPDEQGGPRGLEPTRYGDWERKGTICDF